MIKDLMNKLVKAKTSEEILSCKPQVLELYNKIYDELCEHTCSITNYEDIKSLHALEFPMMAYYGPHFYSKCGIPFLKEHNPSTIKIIEFSMLFYTLQVFELIENGFFDKATLCIYDEERSFDIFDHTENVNLLKYKYKSDLFVVIWFYFMRVITIENDEREFTLEYDYNTDTFYLSDEKHEEVLDMIYKNYADSKYFNIIEKILGIYRIRFTKMTYILKYQPLFVKVGYEFLCAIILENDTRKIS